MQNFTKQLNLESLKKKLNWDIIDPYVDGFEITAANRNFNFLITNGKQAIKKILFFVHANFDSQEHSRFMTDIEITNINLTINDKDYFNMMVDRDYLAYELLRENFNMMGTDVNTGSLIPFNYWKENARLYCVDVSRIKELEDNPSLDMKIRLRGTAAVDGRLTTIMFQDKTTVIDYANPNNTNTTINVI